MLDNVVIATHVTTENAIWHLQIRTGSKRKKLMKALGSDTETFKGYDHVVHGGAIKIKQAAKDKDMVVVIAEYQQVITGCQSCHSLFKAELSKALR